jgi:hypothetical protein
LLEDHPTVTPLRIFPFVSFTTAVYCRVCPTAIDEADGNTVIDGAVVELSGGGAAVEPSPPPPPHAASIASANSKEAPVNQRLLFMIAAIPKPTIPRCRKSLCALERP